MNCLFLNQINKPIRQLERGKIHTRENGLGAIRKNSEINIQNKVQTSMNEFKHKLNEKEQNLMN